MQLKKYSSKFLYIVLALVVLASAFGGGFWTGRRTDPTFEGVEGVINKPTPENIEADFSLFWEVWRKLEKNYYKPESLKPQSMVYGAIKGLVNSTEDPYTEYMPPATSKSFQEDISGSFEGIGAKIGIKNNTLIVISPLKSTPAEKAGLKSGDKIMEINGESTSDIGIQEAVNKIRGPKGSKVTLTIVRDSLNKAKDISIERGKIKIPIVEWEMKHGDTAYIQLYHFTRNAPREFRQAAQDALSSGADKFILDLRNNPGGYLQKAVQVGGWFLPSGKVVAVEDFGKDKESNKYRTQGPALLKDFPLVVLLNQGSASASEILAAALRYHRGIKIVGKKSFGKGSVQTLKEFEDSSSLKVTVAKWLTPSGESISGEGIKPDYEVKLKKKDIEANRDPQLQKAIDILNKKN